MPIVDIELIAVAVPPLDPSLTQRLADSLGDVFGGGAGRTWVKLRRIDPEHYAENGVAPVDSLPVFVSVLKAQWLAESERATEVEDITKAVADVLERPRDSVHVRLEPPGVGRQAFGGVLVR